MSQYENDSSKGGTLYQHLGERAVTVCQRNACQLNGVPNLVAGNKMAFMARAVVRCGNLLHHVAEQVQCIHRGFTGVDSPGPLLDIFRGFEIPKFLCYTIDSEFSVNRVSASGATTQNVL